MVDKKGLDSYNSTPEESKNKKYEADNEDNESTFFHENRQQGTSQKTRCFFLEGTFRVKTESFNI